MRKGYPMVGLRFGRLTVLERHSIGSKGVINWLCTCDCGNSRVVLGTSLRNGVSKSCGCLNVEKTKESNTKHGYRLSRPTKTYRTWSAMLSRCRDSYNKDYGGRGITVCERWKKFENFLEDIGDIPEGMSIERLDCNRNYSPENCTLIPVKEQSRNRRSTLRLSVNGVETTWIKYCEMVGLDRRKTYDKYRAIRRHNRQITKDLAASTALGVEARLI